MQSPYESNPIVRELLEASNDGFWDWNVETGEVYFSRRWAEMLGYRQEELVPHVSTWEKIVHPEDQEWVMKVLQDHLDGKTEIYQTEHRVKSKDGHWKWILDRGRVVERAPDGRALRAAGAHIDISGRRELDEQKVRYQAYQSTVQKHLQELNQALLESEETFRATMDLAAIGIAHVSLDGHWLRTNPAYCKILGYSEQELKTKTFMDLTHPEDLSVSIRQAERLKNNELPFYHLEKRYLRKDGTSVWVHLIVSTRKDERGNPMYYIACADDITALKELQFRLIESETVLKAVLEQLPIGVAVISADGQKITLNAHLRSLWQGNHTDNKVENGFDVFEGYWPHSGHRIQSHEWPLARALKKGEIIQNEIAWLKALSGKLKIVQTSAMPIRVDSGRLVGAVAVVVDITQQKKTEFELKSAKEAAEIANSAKTAFLANMSHEIRTPLAAIIGFSDLLAELMKDSEEARDYLDRIIRNSQQLTKLIDDILDLSKVEANKVQIEKIPVDPLQIVKEALETLSMKAQAKGLELKLISHPEIPKFIETDPVRLKQILLNLLNNSIKFTQHGSVTVHMTPRFDTHPAKLTFKVIDTGIGISKEQAENLFRPFSQADSSITRQYGGTGLGLALSRKLADLLGGELVLEHSEPQKGSTFCLSIDMGEKSIWQDTEENTRPH